ncbi:MULTISPECIES: DNA-binding transcriptional regulator DsdC [unclassified Janthinobacterium]|uniref:DNA-binding transcriptional regulator DsdC n=1 Tax=unclassified Janthinobacterium TaxID=2610881 RepID=UPI00160FF23E|nr:MULTISPECIES: DNA-binding transcriptional regulator DsdC [unclassified Janthinobacterium]MBB5369961.1 LysR family D-serine deaminase transcriptional activator [Janthinobacterium sp. K2C7]MBB5382767.1 LysR family D-serine deaminase transcriptional activator [Janthinobacterium sp. K2Li3]MBB5384752.1 LysR family D-serine deaminase transcriptional activator [Janthinobacterium sp. K2E3]
MATGAQLTASQFANLHTFLVAARHASFALAAQELALTPSAVSHRIARLEDSLGLLLFERLTRRIRLTTDGQRIYTALQQGWDSLHAAIHGGDALAGNITIHARPSIAQCWLVPRLAGFTALYPDISLDLRVGNEQVDFRAGQVDLAIHYGDGTFPGLAAQHLMDEWLAPVCSPAYACQHDLLDRPENLKNATILHDTLAWPACAPDAEWQLWATALSPTVTLPTRSLRFDRADLCALAAIHHAGIAIGRRQLAQPWLDSGQLILPFGGFSLASPQAYYLVHAARTPLPARVQALVEWLMGQAMKN